MKESIFRRIDRVEYRREMARDPLPGNKSGRKDKCLFLIPIFYGALLLLSRSSNEEWYKMMIGWTNSWWDDWAKENIPAIGKVSENLIVHGDIDQVLLAQHVYSVSPLLVLINAIFMIIILQFRPKHLRTKRMIIHNVVNHHDGAKKLNALLLALTIAIPTLICFVWYGMYNKGFLYREGAHILTRYLLFHYTDWASCMILFVHWGGCYFLYFVGIGMYHTVKIRYVNIRQQMRFGKIE